MRAIFLDIDGVMNSTGFLRELPELAPGENWEHHAELMLDPDCVARLNRLARAVGAGVVISSSWRHGHTPERLEEILRKRGFDGAFLGETPVIAGPRGREIGAWLGAHPEVEGFVILDDDADMEELMSSLVRTSMATGLTDEHVDAAIKMFPVG